MKAYREVHDAIHAAETSEPPRLVTVELAAFLARAFPPRPMLLSPILPAQGLAMIHAPRGTGKTYFALTLAYAVASGGSAFGWQATEPQPVLMLDGEMPAALMQERLAYIVESFEKKPALGYFRLLSDDLHENGLPDLASPAGQAAYEAELGDAKLLVIDNLSALVKSGRENEADGWQAMQDFLLRLRRGGRSVLMLHHSGKGGQQRGTSRREDVLDTVLSLRPPADYKPSEGARFEVHVEKARGVAGKELDPFEVKLEIRDDAALWTTRGLEAVNLARVIALTDDGLTVRDIADELGMGKSTVGRLQQQARAEGRLAPKAKARPRARDDDD